MARKHRRVHLLEVQNVTVVPGTTYTFTVAPTTFVDGDIYRLAYSTALALSPSGVIPNGTEAVVITSGALTVQLGDRRSRIVRSERVHPGELISMLYTADSLVSGLTVPAIPAFVVLEGISPLI